MGSFLLTYICSKEEFGHNVNGPISDLFNIDGNNVDEVEFIFEEGIYLYMFYCLHFLNETPKYVFKEKLREEVYLNLDLE